MTQHVGHRGAIVQRSANTQRCRGIQLNDLIEIEVAADAEGDRWHAKFSRV